MTLESPMTVLQGQALQRRLAEKIHQSILAKTYFDPSVSFLVRKNK